MTTADPTLFHHNHKRTGSINLGGIGSSAIFVPIGVADEDTILTSLQIRLDTSVAARSVIFGFIPSGTAQATGNVTPVATTQSLASASLTADTLTAIAPLADGSGFPTVIPQGASYGFMFDGDVTTGLFFAWYAALANKHFPLYAG